MKINKFTKFGFVSLRSNQAVTCERSPKSIQSLILPIFESHIKISKFTKFGNQAVTCQRSPKFHTNVSNSEMTSLPKSIHKSQIFPMFESLLHGCNLTTEPQTW